MLTRLWKSCLSTECFRCGYDQHKARVCQPWHAKTTSPHDFPRLQFGSKPLERVTDQFLSFNLSVQDYVQGLKFCMLEHFSSQRLSHLSCASAATPSTASTTSTTTAAQPASQHSQQKRPRPGESRPDTLPLFWAAATRHVQLLSDDDIALLCKLPSVSRQALRGNSAASKRRSATRWLAELYEHRVAWRPAFDCLQMVLRVCVGGAHM